MYIIYFKLQFSFISEFGNCSGRQAIGWCSPYVFFFQTSHIEFGLVAGLVYDIHSHRTLLIGPKRSSREQNNFIRNSPGPHLPVTSNQRLVEVIIQLRRTGSWKSCQSFKSQRPINSKTGKNMRVGVGTYLSPM